VCECVCECVCVCDCVCECECECVCMCVCVCVYVCVCVWAMKNVESTFQVFASLKLLPNRKSGMSIPVAERS
jgi:hypothetical protein